MNVDQIFKNIDFGDDSESRDWSKLTIEFLKRRIPESDITTEQQLAEFISDLIFATKAEYNFKLKHSSIYHEDSVLDGLGNDIAIFEDILESL